MKCDDIKLQARTYGMLAQGKEHVVTLPASQTQHEVTGLKRNQRREFQVAASTEVGEGPRSPSIFILTSDQGACISFLDLNICNICARN